ncbi:2-amino-4-hydroxy-6-hydroxymethyldihydropteridine diphosphokinase [Polycladidibacter stylochi]|uniref:2-amino-4-hydroxy-6- hydroxymethyldihydropteridine diphosphokinase n=1 Tax=Polycladidibacter stylochi TaxID=1807766 RepID=UPI001FCB9FF4|nr:2-amino-4-hydroxy-6-hydroxymethyldihydropteridine diphosphokinase [Pseudovibrio stylochi]
MLKKAALGLGSNIGDTKNYIDQAVDLLCKHPRVELCSRSRDYRTPPWGPVAQDYYRNCCITVRTSLEPEELLRHCLQVEQMLGRTREVRWGPRTIDIDLLLIEGIEHTSDALIIPHPRMSERGFVLMPLAEIWPDGPINKQQTVRGALQHSKDLAGITLYEKEYA